jgi:hypothetical protein
MKALITATGQIGPFASITRTTGDTGWLAGDCIYPDGVIGDATVGDYTPPTGLRASVEAAVAAGSQDTKDWYAFSTEFLRTNSEVIAMGEALEVSPASLDALWILAGSL